MHSPLVVGKSGNLDGKKKSNQIWGERCFFPCVVFVLSHRVSRFVRDVCFVVVFGETSSFTCALLDTLFHIACSRYHRFNLAILIGMYRIVCIEFLFFQFNETFSLSFVMLIVCFCLFFWGGGFLDSRICRFRLHEERKMTLVRNRE